MGKTKKKEVKTKAKSEEKAPAKKKTKKSAEKEVIVQKAEKAPFMSMCGLAFDPAEGSECAVLCQDSDPDEYKKCLENFKTSPVKPATKPKKKGKGKNKWGRLIGSQAAKIEDILDNDEPMSTEDIAKKAGCTVSRVRRHFLRLIHKEKQTNILIDKEGLVFLPDRFPERTGEIAYPEPKKRAV